MVVDLLARAGGRAEAPALVGPDRGWSYAQLDAEVGRRAERLRSDGVVAGAVAALVVRPTAEDVIGVLAHWRLGAVVAPLHPMLTEAERSEAAAALSDAPPGAQAIVWTSGTGGRRRGVAISFDNLAASARGAAERLSLGPRDVWLASLSPAHVGGLALVTRSLLLGGTLVAAGSFEAAGASALIDGATAWPSGPAPVTHLSVVPTQLARLLEHRRGSPPPETFRCALVGGAHAPAKLVEEAHRAGWPLALTYGATEMCSQIATAPPALTREKPGTVGEPLAGVEVRLAPGGEVLARGATRALSYVIGAPASGTPSLARLADGDGWYRTGDLGRLDDDGDLWIVGRRADRIVSGGVTIDAQEVEEALRAHPSVLDACVVGVPDEEWGERVAACVVPVAGEFDPEEVEEHLRGILSGPKLPRLWRLERSLPKNPNGKTDRAAVRRAFAEAEEA